MSARSHSSASERCSSGSAGTKRSAAAMNQHASGSSSSSEEDEENPRTQGGKPSFQPVETNVPISASLPAPLPTISPTQRSSQRVGVASTTEGDSGLSDVNSSREDGTHASGRETPLSSDLLDADLAGLGNQLGALFAPISPPPPPEQPEDAEAADECAGANTSEWRSAACPSPTESISSAASATPSSCTSCSSCRQAAGASLRRRKKRPSLQSEPTSSGGGGNNNNGNSNGNGAGGNGHLGVYSPIQRSRTENLNLSQPHADASHTGDQLDKSSASQAAAGARLGSRSTQAIVQQAVLHGRSPPTKDFQSTHPQIQVEVDLNSNADDLRGDERSDSLTPAVGDVSSAFGDETVVLQSVDLEGAPDAFAPSNFGGGGGFGASGAGGAQPGDPAAMAGGALQVVPEIRKYKKRFNGEVLCASLWGVNLLIGTESGLMFLDRSGQGKVYPLISRRPFKQMEVLEAQHILVTISGRKGRLRVYSLPYLRTKIMKTEGVDKKHGWCNVGDLRGCVHFKVVAFERIRFLVIALKNSIELFAWAPRPYHKWMVFKSFTDLVYQPLLVDLTIEEGHRLKVLYASANGFHAIDIENNDPTLNLYTPKESLNPIRPHCIVILPETSGCQLLLCYNDRGVYVDTNGTLSRTEFIHWREPPSSVAFISTGQLMGWGVNQIEIRNAVTGRPEGIFLHKNAQRLKFLCERNDKVFFSSSKSGTGSQIYFMVLRHSGLPTAATAPMPPAEPLESLAMEESRAGAPTGLPGFYGLGAFASSMSSTPVPGLPPGFSASAGVHPALGVARELPPVESERF